MLAVYVLAGGRSRRFGSQKLFARLGGVSLIELVLSRLEPLGLPIRLIASLELADELRPLGFDVLVDPYMIGPIGAIAYALSYSDAIVVGGDMPCLSVELIRREIKLWRRFGVGVVPKFGSYLEPLHALYTRQMLDPMLRYIEGGGRGIQRFLRSCRCVKVLPVSSRKPFFNVNNPHDLLLLKSYIAPIV